MPPKRQIQSVDQVRQWFEQGLTYKEMVEEHDRLYGIRLSPSAFSSLRKRENWPPRLVRGEHPLVPWHVEQRHRSSYTYYMLRRAIRLREGVAENDEEEHVAGTRAWIKGLRDRNAVVDYRPNTREGFFLTPARPGIDLDIVREPGTE